jgi:hypothetical protein
MGQQRNSRGKPRARSSRSALAPPRPTPVVWPRHPAWSLGFLALISTVLFREVFLHPGQMLWGNDLVRLHTIVKSAQYRSLWEFGRFPLWDPTEFGGRSIVGDPIAALLNPLEWLFWLTPSSAMFGVYFWAYVTAGAWGMWLWMRRLGAEPVGAVVAAMAFAFSGKTAGHLFAGHLELLPGMLCLPWVMWATEGLLQRRSIASAVVLGAVLGVTATTGSVQALYWHVLLIGIYVTVCYSPLRQPRGWAQAVGLCALAGLVFVLGAMAWWLPVVRQTLLLSARAGQAGGGFDFAMMGSAAPSDLARLIWPFHGRALPLPLVSDPENGFFWESASYPGLVALALAGFALAIAWRERRTRIFGGLALLFLLLALGPSTPLYRLVYDVVPGVAMFRAPGRLLFEANLFLAALSGLGIGKLLPAHAAGRWGFVGVLAALFTVALAGRAPAQSTGSHLAGWPLWAIVTLLTLLVGAVLFACDKIRTRVFAATLVGVCVADLALVWSAHLYLVEPEQVFRPNSVVQFLREQQVGQPYRYFDPTETVPPHLAALNGLQTMTGYHPGLYRHQLEFYQSLWPAGEGSSLVQLLMHSPQDIACTPALDLMNVRFVVAFEPELDDRFVKVFTTPEGEFRTPRHIFERKDWLPRAFVVPASVRPPDGDDELATLCQLDPRTTCLIDAEPIGGVATFQALPVSDKSPGRLALSFELSSPGVLVVSESWHPDWVATDRAVPVTVHRANHGLLGIPLAAGRHDLHLWYRPWDFYLGCAVSGVFWLVVIAAAGWRRWRRSRAARVTVAAPEVSSRS